MCRGKTKSFLRRVTLSASLNLFLRLNRKLLLTGSLYCRVRGDEVCKLVNPSHGGGCRCTLKGACFCERGPDLTVTSRSCPPA